MKSSGIFSLGCQIWDKNVVDSSPSRFAYCSTLSSVTHKLSDYRLERIYSSHKRTLTSLCWSRSDENVFITSGVDNKVNKWNVAKEQPVNTVSLSNKPVMVDWLGQTEATVVVLQKPGLVYLWDCTEGKDSFTAVDALPEVGLTCVRSDRNAENPRVAVGHYTGKVIVYSKSDNSVVEIPPPEGFEGVPVIDLQWDPLTANNICATYENGEVALLDAGNCTVVQVFSHQQVKATQVSFIPSTPGLFVTASRSNSVLTKWSINQVDPLEQVHIHHKTCGINAVKLCNDGENNKVIISFIDGDVGVFAVPQEQLCFKTEPGHSETVYSCKLRPCNQNHLATASHDGSVKLWDLSSKKCLMQLKTGEFVDGTGILYSLSWCPGNAEENRIVTGCSTGELKYWDVSTGQQTMKIRQHSKPIYCVAWNPENVDMIASASSDKTCILSAPDGRVIQKYLHPDAVYGCDWNPFNSNLLATGCHDGVVRLFNAGDTSVKPVAELSGHKARVFCVSWSPLLPNVLATGSDDNTIKVWEYNQKGSKLLYTLEGHTNNIRSLQWNYEVPWLLLSGSWDCTIRVWDIRSPYEKCKEVIYDHLGDVYGLTCHPKRPFVVVSASRDTSIRIWQLESMFKKLQMQTVLTHSMIDEELLMDVTHNMVPETPVRFCGGVGRALKKKNEELEASEPGNKLPAYEGVFDYFTCVPGVMELWRLADTVKKETASDGLNDMVHINDLRMYIKKKARVMEESSVQSNTEEAANTYLKLGDVKKYCEIMIKLGKWETAIAMAPARSMGYWNELTKRYAAHLKGENHPTAVNYLLASGNAAECVEYQCNVLKELDEALLVAAGEACDVLPQVVDEVDDSTEEAKPKEGEREDVMPTDRIREVTHLLALKSRREGEPVKAACYYLAIGDIPKTIQLLTLGGEAALALAISRVFEEDFDYVHLGLARQFELEGLFHESLMCVQATSDPTVESQYLCARFVGSNHFRADFYGKAGLDTKEEIKVKADELLASGDTAKAAIQYIVAKETNKGLELGLEYLKTEIAKGVYEYKQLKSLCEALECADLIHVKAEMRAAVLSYSLYFGLQEASWKGFTPPVIKWFANSLLKIVEDFEVDFPVPTAQVNYQMASYLATIDPDYAGKVVVDVIADKETPPKIKASATALQKVISQVKEDGFVPEVASENIFTPAGSQLPSGNFTNLPVTSVVSGNAIQNGAFVTLEDFKTYLSEDEFMMINSVFPFSVLLNGQRGHRYPPQDTTGTL